jgi:hypothetical protein
MSGAPAASAHALAARADDHFSRGEFSAAVVAYSDALDAAATAAADADAQVALLLARSAAHLALGRVRDFKAALADADRAAATSPGSPAVAYRRGLALRALGQFTAARAALTAGRDAAAAAAAASSAPPPPTPTPAPAAFDVALEELGKMAAAAEGADTDEGALAALAAAEEAAEADTFAQLEAWLTSRGTSSFPFLHMKRYGEGNRGVHARADVPGDMEVMAVGAEFLITVEMGRATPIGRKVAAARLDLSAAKHCYLCIFVLVDRRDPASFFQPYYRILPAAYPNMPIFWSEEEVGWLAGSFMQQQIADRKGHIKADYDAICDVAPEFGAAFSLADFSWARMMVASRNFGIVIDGVRTDALVPYADMLNHWRPRQTRWQFENRKRAFTITSLHALHAGQQVYDSYGKKCNSRFLLNYGFAVDHNRDDDIGQSHNEVGGWGGVGVGRGGGGA